MTNSPITKFKLYCNVKLGDVMDDYWYWEIKFYINFPSGKREGTYSVDRQNASTAELAQKELLIAYKEDPYRLVNGEVEGNNHELVINSCLKVSPDFDLLKPFLKDFEF